MKLEADTVSILPVVPPGAGAVRAFDFPFPETFPASNARTGEVEAATEFDAGVVEFNVAMPTDDPIVPTIKADEAIRRFRLLCSHRGSFLRRVGISVAVRSMPPDSNSFMTALLSFWCSTSVSVFYMKSLKVDWTTRKKSFHFDERSKGDESALSGTFSFYNELKGTPGVLLSREKHVAN